MTNFQPSEMREDRTWFSYAPTWLSFFAALHILWRRFPSVYQDGAMWAEAGQLYFPQAHLESFAANLTALDYGYVPLWCRLWAVMVSRLGVHPANVAGAYNMVALVVAGGCCAVFALPYFRRLVRSDASRALVCLGLALAPDYDTKTFINASYYPAICCYLGLVAAVGARGLSLRKGLAGGMGLGISMLSKPHYMAFAPFLVLILAVAAKRKDRNLALLVALPLVATAVQFAVLYSNRSTVAPQRLELTAYAAIWARWVSSALRYQLVGQAIMAATKVKTLAATVLVAVVARGLVVHRRDLGDLIWPTLLGLGLLASGITLGIVSFPHMYTPAEPQHMYSQMQIRHFFVPMVGCYLTLALVITRACRSRAQPLVLALWLTMAWPFGWVEAPGAPTWPVVGFSAWPTLAHKIFDAQGVSPVRGCIPINPYPRMMSLDCQMLAEMNEVTDLMHRRASTLKERYLAPAASQRWLVDTVGLRVINVDPGTQQLVAYDAAGAEIGRAQAIIERAAALSFFHFTPPLMAPAAVALVDTAMQPSSVVMDAAQDRPLWVWLGREMPEAP